LRAIVQRALLVGAGVVVGLALLEGALRLAAFVLPAHLLRAAKTAVPREPGEFRVLCVGDSHTYGVGVAPDDAYPAQLERILRGRGVRARVINAGVPGQGSSQLLTDLGATVARYQPDVVLVWIGANNQWRILDEAEGAGGSWLDHLRLVRLLRLLLRRFEGVSGDFRRELDRVRAKDGPAVTERPERELRTPAAAGAATAKDLVAVVGIVRQATAVPVLLTYPVAFREMLVRIDEAIVTTGAQLGVRVIDLRTVGDRHRGLGPRLLLPDLHPTGPFYRSLAWEMARTLVRTGMIPPSAFAPAAAAP
jgi:lysophospholipase L1-like esterase